MTLGARGVLALGAVAAVGLLAAWLIKNRQLFDPANPGNLAYQGTSSIVTTLSGGAAAGGEDTLGGAFARLREWLSGDEQRIQAMLQGTRLSAPDPVQERLTAAANAYGGGAAGGWYVG